MEETKTRLAMERICQWAIRLQFIRSITANLYQQGRLPLLSYGAMESWQNDVGKERQNAIQVAAQCLDQAFQHASSNLDAVGLPFTPRLAEYSRVRLKGCEAEVAELLDERWRSFTGEWRAAGQESTAIGF